MSIAHCVAALSVLLLVMLVALPWGLPDGVSLLLPALPFAAVHVWATGAPRLASPALAFASGLAVDALGAGPLGYWSCVYLAGLAATLATAGPAQRPSLGVRWLGFMTASLAFWVVAWALASLYLAAPAAWASLPAAPLLLAALYPLVVLLLAPLAALTLTPRMINMDRGR